MTFDLSLSNPNGINGYRANLLSLTTKNTLIKQPKTIKHTTFGLPQGKVVPPKFSPSSNMTTKPIIEMLPNQSTALMPSLIVVFGLCTSRKRRIRTKARAEQGRLTQKIQRQEAS